DRVADVQCPRQDQQGYDRDALAVEPRLDHDAARLAVRVRLQLVELGDQFDHVEQVVDAGLGTRRYRHRRRVATVLLDHNLVLGQLALHAVKVRVGQV